MTVENHYSEPTREGHERHTEQQAMVTLDRISQPSHMAKNCGQHCAGREDAAHPTQAWHQQANRCEKFPDSLPPAPPRLCSHFPEDINGLWCASEFEEKGFDHDPRPDELADPADHTLTRGERIRGGSSPG